MKIICAGWGRTGTRSIKYALERLLGQPSYHMQNILLNKKDAQIWHNSILKVVLENGVTFVAPQIAVRQKLVHFLLVV